MKLLVTGAGGQLGVDVVLHARSVGDDVVAVDKAALDITDPMAVRELLDGSSPGCRDQRGGLHGGRCV